MQRIGLVGGMSPESTKDYYKILIDLGRERLEGEFNNPEIIIYSINLSLMMGHVSAGRPEEAVALLVNAVSRLESAGAEVGALTANTPHIFFGEISRRSSLPLLSILDACFDEAEELGCRKALLLGTTITMSSEMYPRKFSEGDIGIVIPDDEAQAFVQQSIVGELTQGRVTPETRKRYIEICRRHMEKDGVDSVILGCTEIPMVLKDGDLPITLLNTTRIHAEAIYDAAESEHGGG